jgi:hypothetical protein
MSKIIRLRQVNAEERFRDQLMTARAILRSLIDSEVTEDLLVAVEDLSDDIMKAVDNFRNEGRL